MPVATMPRRQRLNTVTHTRRASEHAALAAISEALRQTGYGQLRMLDLRRDGDSVVLAGRVPTYFLKQLAQSVAMGVPGVGRVDNEIRVVSNEPPLA